MAKQKSPESTDIYASLLSSLAVLVQLLLFIINSLSSTLNVSNFFAAKEFVPFLTLVTIFLSLCLMGVYSFFKKNKIFYVQKKPKIKVLEWIKNVIFTDRDPQSYPEMGPATEKKYLKVGGVTLFVAVLLFIISTLSYSFKEYWWIFSFQSIKYIQTVSYVTMWVLSSFILFVWISNEMELKTRFKEEDFVKNLFETLRDQGYITTKFESIKPLPNSNSMKKYVKTKINSDELHFLVNYDGSKIEEEISEEEAKQLFITQITPQNGT